MRALTLVALSTLLMSASAQDSLKTGPVLYPPDVVNQVRQNVANDPWAAGVRDDIVEAAAPWMAMSDDELWDLMFGATLKRSWMVWSDGYSPATGDPVPMYNWQMDALEYPWKTKCPHSGELFPKNDFKTFYDSGLDEHNIFDPNRADRSLLFNTDHPDPDDPLHMYGVDDGDGYVNEKGERWRFINAYLIYGQWKQGVVAGIQNLSAAYLLTGEKAYAHKAGVLLDRVADVYPTFDFKDQGVMYEGPGAAGYVSTWHDACEETRQLATAYDIIFEGIEDDEGLVAFLSQKAKDYGIENPKASFADIQRNIEGRILRDALTNAGKIHSNYPRTEIVKALITKILGESDDAFWAIVDPMLERATAVDGVTGEKGLAGYASFTIAGMALFLSECSKADPNFLAEVLERHPRVHDAYRFHIDTFCLDRYYPLIGDTGSFARPMDRYVGMYLLKPGGANRYKAPWTPLPPSDFRLLWDLYEATDDVAFVQTLYRENGGTVDGLPYDVFGESAEEFRKNVTGVIGEYGEDVELESVHKEEWKLALLRSSDGDDERTLWLDYDAGGGHGHQDAMNIGLFAYGLDLLPEMGYPPVQYGGWGSPRSRWYTMSAAHNTVVVDRKNHAAGAGEASLWAEGRWLHGIRANAPAVNGGNRFERTVFLIDVSEEEFYVVDVFRVAGGKEHTKFVHSHFGDLTLTGVDAEAAGEFGGQTQMRNMKLDTSAEPGWTGVWDIEDRYNLLPDDVDVGVRYTDLTNDVAAGTIEGWISYGGFNATEEEWIPRIVVQRAGEEGLSSTFVSVYEPFKGDAPKRSIARVGVVDDAGNTLGDNQCALEIVHADGKRDIILLADPEQPGTLITSTTPTLETDAEFGFIRLRADGVAEYGAFANGSRMKSGQFILGIDSETTFIETP